MSTIAERWAAADQAARQDLVAAWESAQSQTFGQQAGGRAKPAASAPKAFSSETFAASFVAPSYLVDGILQSGRLYSLTGPTGAFKTGVAILLSACLAAGEAFCGHDVKQGRVLFLTGENPDDVRARWICQIEALGLPLSLPVTFVEGPFDVVEQAEFLRGLGRDDPFSLCAVDTAAAFFTGADDNSNVALGNYARDLRRVLCGLPGAPATLVLSHPTKYAAKDGLLPRGGGAFLAEVDGNLTAWTDDREVVELHWQGKFRGPDFQPFHVRITPATSERVKDAEGRLMPSVIATPLDAGAVENVKHRVQVDEDSLLTMMLEYPDDSHEQWCCRLGWINAKQEPAKYRVTRALKRLADDGMATKLRNRWQLTKAGKSEAERVR